MTNIFICLIVSDGSKIPAVNPEVIKQPTLDHSQEEALSMAYTKPFSVIRGAAGSGKSSLAARLTLNFVEKNRRTPRIDMKPQVLICGPSEQTLDSIAGKFYTWGISMKHPEIISVRLLVFKILSNNKVI